MKKFSLCLLLFIVGCTPSEDKIRNMVKDELQQLDPLHYFSNPQIAGPYSPAVQAGRFLFISSQASTDLETNEFIEGTVEEQTHQSLQNIMTLLSHAGFDSSNVVQCTIYLKDLNDFTKMNLIFGGYFEEGKYPARTVVAVSDLREHARVEISAIAFKP
ncbi:MAG TPA: Rid family detoxifying hydrolase [Bacteroidota bacterium]|nr:Rid family detoxifying hydrolase [Bacteroidota bacterium]